MMYDLPTNKSPLRLGSVVSRLARTNRHAGNKRLDKENELLLFA